MLDPKLEKELDQIRHPSEKEISAESMQVSRERHWNIWFLAGAVGIVLLIAGASM